MDGTAFESAVVDLRKLTHYLLAADHPEGGSKARFFLACGFTAEAPNRLSEALLRQGAEGEVHSSLTDFGVKYVVDGPLISPDGRDRRIRSVWIVEAGDRILRFVTAYPWRFALALVELDRVVLTRDAPDVGLAAGDVGVIVHAYADHGAFEVEVFSLTGDTVAIATLPADALRPVGRQDVVSARMASAR